MKRLAIAQLVHWKNSRNRRPLLLRGARQVGKTHLLKTFGEQEYKNCFHFDFEKQTELQSCFENNLSPDKILDDLSTVTRQKIDPQTDLIIFDEIQACPRALSSLKYFCEDMPELHLCCAGSLLGVTLSTESFPVGNVEFLDLYPLNFEEFLLATQDALGIELFEKLCKTHHQSEVEHQRLWDIFKQYCIVGGMPRVINTYLTSKNLMSLETIAEIRDVQKDHVDSYHKDFAKHAGNVNSMHIVSVFENVPMQLAQSFDGSVQRYRFRDVIPNKKSFADLQGPIDWLEKAGLIIKVKICNLPEIPFEAFCKQNLFKLYAHDIGLLGSMLNIPPETILMNELGMTKGFLIENYVATELLTVARRPLHCWMGDNSEIEFLQVINAQAVPLEVKAGKRTQAKSLRVFFEKFSPPFAIKLSACMLDDSNSKKVKNLPLYLTGQLTSWFSHT